MSPPASPLHSFHAVAYAENFVLRDLAPEYPEGKLGPHELHVPLGKDGNVFLYSFGAVVFHDVAPDRRHAELEKLASVRPGLTPDVRREEFSVREDPGAESGIRQSMLVVDRLTTDRAAIVALTVGQSAAMEYYERIVEKLFRRTDALIDRLERHGTVSMRTRPMHKFIGEALGIRNEVLSVLHLLDKPDATWDDPAMDGIYADLREEFDLVDRYEALGSKVSSVQDSLELVLDVARDRRMVFLEVTIVALFVFEIGMSFLRVAH